MQRIQHFMRAKLILGLRYDKIVLLSVYIENFDAS